MSTFDRGDPVGGLIFSPDPVGRFMHEKVHGAQRRLAGDPALRALMFAVLEDAIACYQDYYFKPSGKSERLFQEAEEWINSNDDGIFSFNNICETLGLDSNNLKKGLEQWKSKQVRRSPEEPFFAREYPQGR